MTKREAPLSVLKDLAEADDALSRCINSDQPGDAMPLIEAQHRALAAYRAATAPLRTRAEVAAELYEKAQQYFSRRGFDKLEDSRRYGDLYGLCCEPTSDPGPFGASGAPATKESSDTAGAPAGAAHSDPADERPCGCEETEGLNRKLVVIRIHAQRGLGPHVNPRCPAEAACRAIVEMLDSP